MQYIISFLIFSISNWLLLKCADSNSLINQICIHKLVISEILHIFVSLCGQYTAIQFDAFLLLLCNPEEVKQQQSLPIFSASPLAIIPRLEERIQQSLCGPHNISPGFSEPSLKRFLLEKTPSVLPYSRYFRAC